VESWGRTELFPLARQFGRILPGNDHHPKILHDWGLIRPSTCSQSCQPLSSSTGRAPTVLVGIVVYDSTVAVDYHNVKAERGRTSYRN